MRVAPAGAYVYAKKALREGPVGPNIDDIVVTALLSA